MTELLVRIVNTSLSAGILILVLVIIRAAFRRIPRTVVLILWGVVALRLMLLVSIAVPSIPISAQQIVSVRYEEEDTISLHSDLFTAFSDNHSETESTKPQAMEETRTAPTESVHSGFLEIAPVIWICGIVLIFLYSAISSFSLKQRLKYAKHESDNIYFSERIDSPFIYGAFSPKIYLPYTIAEDDVEYVLEHEKAHITYHDHISKIIGFVLLSVYWFNPLIWIAFILFSRDLEYRCDEAVIRRMGAAAKKPYAHALINSSVESGTMRMPLLGFAEIKIKRRIENIMKYKEVKTFIVAAAILLIVAFALLFITSCIRPADPAEQVQPSWTDTSEAASSGKEILTMYIDRPPEGYGIGADAAVSKIWEDENCYLLAPCGPSAGSDYPGDDRDLWSEFLLVKYKDGTTEQISDALDAGRITVDDVALYAHELKISIESKNKEAKGFDSDKYMKTQKEVLTMYIDYPPEGYKIKVVAAAGNIWEDELYCYGMATDPKGGARSTFPGDKRTLWGEFLLVKYKNGKTETITDALEAGRITIDDVMKYADELGITRIEKKGTNK